MIWSFFLPAIDVEENGIFWGPFWQNWCILVQIIDLSYFANFCLKIWPFFSFSGIRFLMKLLMAKISLLNFGYLATLPTLPRARRRNSFWPKSPQSKCTALIWKSARNANWIIFSSPLRSHSNNTWHSKGGSMKCHTAFFAFGNVVF